jgi:hypothetical protein
MNNLSKEEILFMELYKNYSKTHNNLDFKILDNKWTKSGTKEKTWIQLYTKFSIEPHIEALLFVPKFNEQEVISEMDTFITSLKDTK